ncbi:unnamed protein product, partial [Meganyctiphanes norvegica]
VYSLTILDFGNQEEQLMLKLLGSPQDPLEQDDPFLLDYVRDRVLEEPSHGEYNLMVSDKSPAGKKYNEYRTDGVSSWVFINKTLDKLFAGIHNGFFVEAGALDGEYTSNSLELERQGWSGLLVEVDQDMVVKLKEKKRKAWSAHACLATKPYPHVATLMKMSKRKSDNQMGSVEIKALSALSDTRDIERRQKYGDQHYVTVQCYPVYTLLKALGVSKVDFISLDVEDVEVSVLENFPFEKMQVDVWAVEHRHPDAHVFEFIGEDPQFIKWFSTKGYSMYKYYKNDYIFIRKGSNVHKRAFKNNKSIHKLKL